MKAIRFHDDRIGYRGMTPAEAGKLRLRWTVRAQLWGLDRYGRPARFHATFRTPNAVRFRELAGTINGLLTDVADDMRAELGDTGVQHVAAGWIAVSESPRKSAKRSR